MTHPDDELLLDDDLGASRSFEFALLGDGIQAAQRAARVLTLVMLLAVGLALLGLAYFVLSTQAFGLNLRGLFAVGVTLLLGTLWTAVAAFAWRFGRADASQRARVSPPLRASFGYALVLLATIVAMVLGVLAYLLFA